MAHLLTPLDWSALAPRGALGAESFTTLHREMDRLFGNFLRDFNGPAPAGGDHGAMLAMPRIDVSETDKDIRIEVDLAGMKEDQVDIELVDDMLSIRGERKLETDEQRKGYHVK